MIKKYKRINYRIFAALLAVVLSLNLMSVLVAAAETTSTRETVRVGYFPFAGYHEIDENGVMSGYGYDVLSQMIKYENWKYEYVGYDENISWADSLEMLDNGKVDMLTSATISGERLEKYLYSDVPIGTSSTIITVKSGNNKYDTSDYSNWNGITVGVLENNSRNESFATYANSNGFSYNTVEYDSTDNLTNALYGGKVDMIVTSNLLSLSGVKVVDKFDEKPFYVIVKKDNNKLMAEVNNALSQITGKNPSFAEDLYKKYYDPQSDGVVSYTKEEQRFIDECNANNIVFKAVVNADRKPLAFWDNGMLSGLLVDFSQMIFSRTGLKFEFENCDSREEYIDAIANKTTDVVCDFTGKDGAAENYGFVATDAYYSSSVSMLVKKGYDGNGKICALTKNSITDSKVKNLEGVEYIYYETNKECQEAVQKGEADFTYSYTRAVQDIVYLDVTNSLACITAPDFSVEFKMAVNMQDNSLLSSIITRSVNSITEKDVSYLFEPYTYYDRTEKNLISIMYDNPILFVISIVIFFVVAFGTTVIVINVKKRKNDKITNAKLLDALAEADNANQAKTDFLSRVSHDMRTPLNGILGLTTLMREKVENEEQKRDLDQLQISGEYLLNLVNDTLDVSRIENGKLEIHPEVCPGRLLLTNIVSLAQRGMIEKNIQFNVYENNAPFEMFYIDVARTEQVFLNVLGNAAKFTPQGGTVNMYMNKILSDDDGFVIEITIQDTGVGMSEEFIPHLFEPFSQADSSKKNAFKGTGLGMTITKQILTLMGGDIQVESKLGVGTKVAFTLPIKLATKEQIEEYEKKTENSNNDIFKGKHVLLCEDHPLNATIAVRLLTNKGMIVDHVENGQLGVAKFNASPTGFYSAILMDIRMPVMDGLEATRVIRGLEREDAKRVPIIAMTANAFEDDVKQTIESGMNAHLGKPIDTERIFEVLREKISG